MLTREDREIVTELKFRLAQLLPILDMRVFGSRARGKATPDSDLDVFIKVESCSSEVRREIDEIAWEVGFEKDCIISMVVATSAQLENGPLGASPLMLNIEQEGIAV
jgi:predicted nucleotidyltransferase